MKVFVFRSSAILIANSITKEYSAVTATCLQSIVTLILLDDTKYS